MNKLSNILNESSKSDFQTEVRIELENGLVLEGTFKVTDHGLSYAKETSNKLVESNIKNIEVLSVEPIVEKVESETETEVVKEAVSPIIMMALKDKAESGDEEALKEFNRLKAQNKAEGDFMKQAGKEELKKFDNQ